MTNNKQHRRLIWQLPFLVLLIVGTILIVRQNATTPYQHHEGMVFGTTYHFTYKSNDDLHQEMMAALQEVDNTLSAFNPESMVSAVNQGKQPALNGMFRELYTLARQVSEETDGAFDITVAPLVNAWGFGFKQGQMPGEKQLDSLRQLVGYQKVEMKQLGGQYQIVKQAPGIMLDFSAIAKGYGSDRVADCLRRHGVTDFMVEIGGEIVVSGKNSKQEKWRIGVTKPADDSLAVNEELQTILPLTDAGMATSGNYRNFYYQGGKKYAHTIDPLSGRPVQHSLLSATVVAANCATADAYATAFMVMGMEKAKALLKRHSELKAYLIYADDKGQLQVWDNLTK